ncbi:MAG TPA: polysaccharide deacetylase family protein [Candidatus Saccharimonadales bacterium]|nr:polysaccharide deacetylase family protein [Candidatus Saccharimonadales bacterium]
MKRKLRRLLVNPLVVIPPFVLVLAFGWHHYIYASRDLSLPSSAGNLLHSGLFGTFGADGTPIGWQLQPYGDLHYSVSHSDGYAAGNTFALQVSGYHDGDLAFTSPKTAASADETYLFKGYYTATAGFTLLMRYVTGGQPGVWTEAAAYPASVHAWTTVSHAFQPPAGTDAVQFEFRLSADGQLQLNSLYIQSDADVSVTAVPDGPNLIPNYPLAATGYNAPDEWSTYRTGTNNAAFSYEPGDSSGAYVQATASDYQDGEAKWQYVPQAVQAAQYFQAGVEYRSDVSVPLVAEFSFPDGRIQDQTLADLPPAQDWTAVTRPFEVPPDATGLFIALPLHRDGTVASRNYSLTDISKPVTPQWPEPVVSLTFDDGWQQTFQTAAPLLQQFGYDATFYINPLAIETPGFMTATELTSLARSGHEIAAHGYEHDDLTAVSKAALDYQLRQGRDYLRGAGFSVTDFAPPYGRSDAEVRWSAERYYTTLRGTSPGLNTRQNLDPYDLKVMSITSSTTPTAVSQALAAAKAYHGWLVLVYHQVSSHPVTQPDTENAPITPAALKAQLAQLKASGIRVLPVAAAYHELQP